MRASQSLLVVAVAYALGACGDDNAKQAPPQKADRTFDQPGVLDAKASGDEPIPAAKPDLGVDPFGAAQWDTDGGDTDGGPPEPDTAGDTDGGQTGPKPHPGPCKIRWSTGAIVRFDYDDDGSGKVRVDQDADGKADTCGSFETAEGKVARVSIDEGCDNEVDIVLEPAHDPKLNVATAVYDDDAGKRQITLVTMTQFTGLDPGYVLHAPRKSVRLRSKGDRIRSAEVRKPHEGPPMRVTFTYDDEGRVKRIKEDHGLDKTTDRQFDYRYDDRGNVVAMRVILGSGENQQRGTARIDYSCHEQ